MGCSMIKTIISLNTEDLKGLLNHRGMYHFVDQSKIMLLFVRQFYNEKTVVLIYECKKAFQLIPKLNILKRDDFSSYMLGINSDLVFVEFDTILLAQDWVFSFPPKTDIHWEIYSNGKLYRNEKGKIKNG